MPTIAAIARRLQKEMRSFELNPTNGRVLCFQRPDLARALSSLGVKASSNPSEGFSVMVSIGSTPPSEAKRFVKQGGFTVHFSNPTPLPWLLLPAWRLTLVAERIMR
jgi:hypothetical protein